MVDIFAVTSYQQIYRVVNLHASPGGNGTLVVCSQTWSPGLNTMSYHYWLAISVFSSLANYWCQWISVSSSLYSLKASLTYWTFILDSQHIVISKENMGSQLYMIQYSAYDVAACLILFSTKSNYARHWSQSSYYPPTQQCKIHFTLT